MNHASRLLARLLTVAPALQACSGQAPPPEAPATVLPAVAAASAAPTGPDPRTARAWRLEYLVCTTAADTSGDRATSSPVAGCGERPSDSLLASRALPGLCADCDHVLVTPETAIARETRPDACCYLRMTRAVLAPYVSPGGRPLVVDAAGRQAALRPGPGGWSD